jgi:pilus assembly protein CpaC
LRPVARTGGNAVLSRVRLTVNKSQTYRTAAAVGDVLVGSSEIADVVPVSDRTLYLLGKKVGTTNVSLFDAEKRLVGIIDVEVRPDVETIESQIRQSTGGSGLSVRSQGDRTILTGEAYDAPSVDRALQVAPPGTVNLTRVKSPQQVMLKVRFVEVNRTAGRELGFRFEYGGRSSAASIGTVGGASQVTSGSGGISVAGFTGAVVNAATSGAIPFATVIQRLSGATNQLDLFISALEAKGLVRRLAEPNLIAMSGDRAEFLAGGEIPIPIANQSVSGAPQITVSYKEFGVKLAFTPTVLTNGNIHLQLEPEVSDIDPTLAVAVGGGVSVPGLTKRRARTNVELRDGQSFAIAGLLQTQSSRSIDQLPWLGSIPILGALFRSTEFQERDTELVVIVTPALVKPAKPGQLLANPLETTLPANDVDLFLNGKLELRRNMREFVSSRGAVVGPHGHLMPKVAGDPLRVN